MYKMNIEKKSAKEKKTEMGEKKRASVCVGFLMLRGFLHFSYCCCCCNYRFMIFEILS